ncbi:hypothetical protein D9M73_70270 [compost metagenome]
MAVAVVKDETLLVMVTPRAAEMSAPGSIRTPVPLEPPTVALPVMATVPAGAATLPAMRTPVPSEAAGLLKVPFTVTFPPLLDTSEPLPRSTPVLPASELLPTRPVMPILPAVLTLPSESSRTPRDTCATAPEGQPASPLMVMAPLPAVMLELVMTTPPAEPPVALAPPLERLPDRLMVPAPPAMMFDCVAPLFTISSEWVSLLPDALRTTLPLAALTLLPSTWMLPLAAVRLALPPPVFWMPSPWPMSVTTILPVPVWASAIEPPPVLMALRRAALMAASPPAPLLMPLAAVIFRSPAFSVAPLCTTMGPPAVMLRLLNAVVPPTVAANVVAPALLVLNALAPLTVPAKVMAPPVLLRFEEPRTFTALLKACAPPVCSVLPSRLMPPAAVSARPPLKVWMPTRSMDPTSLIRDRVPE